MSSIMIYFDKHAYESAKANVIKKKEAFKLLKEEASRFVKIKDEEQFKKNPINYFEWAILDKFKEKNSMGLSFKKLADVMELNFGNLFQMARDYSKMRFPDVEPKESDFEMYAVTPEQKQRYKDACELVDALYKAKKHRPYLGFLQLAADLQGLVRFDMASNKIYPNHYFVLEKA